MFIVSVIIYDYIICLLLIILLIYTIVGDNINKDILAKDSHLKL